MPPKPIIGALGQGDAVDAQAQQHLALAFQQFVTNAKLVWTLVGLLISVCVGSLAVYQHFAKSGELKELACKVVEQNQINNEMIAQSREIQAALKIMKENFEATPDRQLSAKFIADAISASVTRIEKSLAKITELREAGQKDHILKRKGPECQ